MQLYVTRFDGDKWACSVITAWDKPVKFSGGGHAVYRHSDIHAPTCQGGRVGGSTNRTYNEAFCDDVEPLVAANACRMLRATRITDEGVTGGQILPERTYLSNVGCVLMQSVIRTVVVPETPSLPRQARLSDIRHTLAWLAVALPTLGPRSHAALIAGMAVLESSA
jgi:hypothetical protein